MIVICVLFGFSLTRAFKILYWEKVDLKNSFAKTVIMGYFYNVNQVGKDAFNTILKVSYA